MHPPYDDPDDLRIPDDRLRAGDADRERVAEQLRRAHAEGRLDADELDERIARCLRARTFGELARLTADVQSPARPAGRTLIPRERRRGLRIVLAAIVAVWALGAATHGHAHAGGLLVALVFVFLATRLVRAVRA
jgi:hypothetical protein